MPNQFTGVAPAERFWLKVDMGHNQAQVCWLWTGALNASGYGVFYASDATILAHRWSAKEAGMPLAEGMEVDHLCRVRACVRPSHLEVVTPDENKRRTSLDDACQRGHKRTDENTYIRADGERYCRDCKNERDRAAYARHKARADAIENGADW